jgi:hypothetical protein
MVGVARSDSGNSNIDVLGLGVFGIGERKFMGFQGYGFYKL